MIIYNINALYHKVFLELATIAAKYLILNGQVKKEQIRVKITKNLLTCTQEIVRLNSVIGFNGVEIVDSKLEDWLPKTHIVDSIDTSLIDYIVNVDADCFLTQQIDLDEFVTDKIQGYDLALYRWDTNAANSYKNRLSLACPDLKPSLTTNSRFSKTVNGIISESGLDLRAYEQELPTLSWLNGGFTIYSNKHLIKQWKNLQALNSICLSDEFAFSILDFLYKQTRGSFGLNINILDSQKEILPHHYMNPKIKLDKIGLMHLLGSTKTEKEDEIKELYYSLIVDA